jgi:hypothetical protein
MDDNKYIGLQYFPNIIWFKSLGSCKNLIFPTYQEYNKRVPLNRCTISGANGPIILSIPLLGGRNQKSAIKDLKVDNECKWQVRHWRSLQSAYNSSPWFNHFHDDLAVVYFKRFEFLIDWNYYCLTWLDRKLKIDRKYSFIMTEEPNTIEVILNPSAKRIEGLSSTDFNGLPRYSQVFEERTGFIPNLSVLDLLFCIGPNKTIEYLEIS